MQRQRLHGVGGIQRELERHARARRVPDDVRPLDADVAHERAAVRGLLGEAQRRPRRGRCRRSPRGGSAAPCGARRADRPAAGRTPRRRRRGSTRPAPRCRGSRTRARCRRRVRAACPYSSCGVGRTLRRSCHVARACSVYGSEMSDHHPPQPSFAELLGEVVDLTAGLAIVLLRSTRSPSPASSSSSSCRWFSSWSWRPSRRSSSGRSSRRRSARACGPPEAVSA